MKATRGEFRSLSVVLLDGPDFRRLPAEARWILILARLSTGPSAIAAMPGFMHLLADRSGYHLEVVQHAWQVIEDEGWGFYDGIVAWIVRGLDFEPSRDLGDWKHRVYLHKYVEGLPRCALIGAFVARYWDWWNLGGKGGEPVPPPSFPAPEGRLAAWMVRHRLGTVAGETEGSEELPSEHPARPLQGPSKAPARPSGDTDRETETERETEKKSAARASDPEELGWNEARLREVLPAQCHRNLRRVLMASGPGTADGIARMAGLDPKAIPTGPGMQCCTTAEVAEVINRIAEEKPPHWRQVLANRILETIRREERRDPRTGRDGARRATGTTGAPSL